MALNFPDSPVAGTVFGAWRYDGTKWGAVSGVSGGGSAGDITAVLAGTGLSGGGTEGDVTVSLAVPVTVARGGTGATDAATARTNLGAAPLDQGVTLTGDISGSGAQNASVTTTLATVNANVGTFQGLTVNAKGLITAATNQSYLQPPVNLTSQVTGTLPVANGGTGAATGNVGPYLPLVAGSGNALTGPLYIVATDPAIDMRKGGAGTSTHITGRTGANVRWEIQIPNGANEAGSNSGSDLAVIRFNDAGSVIDTPLLISRASADVTLTGVLNAGGVLAPAVWLSAGGYPRMHSNGNDFVFQLKDDTGNFYWYNRNSALIGRCYGFDGKWYNLQGTWSTISDASVKENIQPYTRGLADLVQLRPVAFNYVEGIDVRAGQERFGLVAQDVEPFVPEIVGQTELEEKTVLTLDPANLMYAVLNSLREIEARLRALEEG